jgi:hypothetical protein
MYFRCFHSMNSVVGNSAECEKALHPSRDAELILT